MFVLSRWPVPRPIPSRSVLSSSVAFKSSYSSSLISTPLSERARSCLSRTFFSLSCQTSQVLPRPPSPHTWVPSGDPTAAALRIHHHRHPHRLRARNRNTASETISNYTKTHSTFIRRRRRCKATRNTEISAGSSSNTDSILRIAE